ncbi:MAG: tetratricopeptide repeat protein [Verrucomicrobia bacterium]|nr:tetratricopeptide repeat protein [Verrucomicrobiota bacterium]
MGLILGGCVPGADSQDEEKNPYYVAGQDRVGARDYAGAIEAFEKALEVNPRSALAHYELGVLYETRENDYAAAIYHYNKVLKLRPQGTYPAENARQRIPGCRLEMIKDDTLETLNPTAMREIERLRKENQLLRQYLETWNAWWQRHSRRPRTTPTPTPAPARTDRPPDNAPAVSAPAFSAPVPARSAAAAARSGGRGASAAAAPRRTHRLVQGDTLMALSRKYGVSLESILAANPGVNPRQLKPGQVVRIP